MRECIRMKLRMKFVLALVFVMAVSACAWADLPSVTMLSTKTCPACEQMSRVLSQIKSDYSGKISTAHIYLEDNPDIAKKYNVRYVPTLLFRDGSGKIVAQEVGYRSMDKVLKVFREKGVKF